jgi:hypothetical protein
MFCIDQLPEVFEHTLTIGYGAVYAKRFKNGEEEWLLLDTSGNLWWRKVGPISK